ncbi:E-selectin-like [Branchiostoma floridae x Branchiostoma japonicum]
MFTCNQGYELEGASSVRCQANRTWNGSVPTCTRNHAFEVLRTASQQYKGVDFFAIEARIPADGLSATENWCRDYQNLCAGYGLRPTGCGETWSSGSISRTRCASDYNSDIYINNVLGCNPASNVAKVANLAFSAEARWDRSFGFNDCKSSTCKLVQCPALTPPDNGALSPTGVSYYNDEVKFTCNQGYELEGASSVRCQANRTWNGSVPTCTAVQCPSLTPPHNGVLSPTGVNSYNDEVMFTCNQGYELEGASSVRCQANRTWSDPVPTCTVVQCPALTPPEDGTLSPTGVNSYNDEVMFTCNQGYELEGASSVRCQANGTWRGPVPTCTVVQCQALTPPHNGTQSTAGVNSYNDEVMFTCNQGYELEGASSVRCQMPTNVGQ